MAVRYHISAGIMFRTIRDIIREGGHRKRLLHRLYPAIIEERRSRVWRTYRRLSNHNYKNYLTSDET